MVERFSVLARSEPQATLEAVVEDERQSQNSGHIEEGAPARRPLRIVRSYIAAAVLLIAFSLAGCTRDDVARPLFFELSIEAVADDPDKVAVVVTASDPAAWSGVAIAGERWQPALSLRRVPEEKTANSESSQTILGNHLVDGTRLVFRPTFPLLRGERYVARFDPAQMPDLAETSMSPLTREYHLPPVSANPVAVEAIYPSARVLPANHLKFYIMFSEPMRQGDIFKHFRLENLTRREVVPRPFRHTELWSSDGRRLTLWFHPGRQKTGVNLNVEIGPVLQAGDEYRLVIAAGWRSQGGAPLGSDVEKMFRAGPPDREQPEPSRWSLVVPPAATEIPLICRFPAPLDWALLQNAILVEHRVGTRVLGQVEIAEHETVWKFHPRTAWTPGKYRLSANDVLEDLAGNSIERPFEVDLTDAAPRARGGLAGLEFTIEPPAPNGQMSTKP